LARWVPAAVESAQTNGAPAGAALAPADGAAEGAADDALDGAVVAAVAVGLAPPQAAQTRPLPPFGRAARAQSRGMAEERRLVTILFSDVAGSTALGEELDPEDLRALLGRYYAIAKDAVAEHGGTLEKFIGDAVMAVFGLPVAHGDDAVRAIAAAEQLRDRVRAEPTLGERLVHPRAIDR